MRNIPVIIQHLINEIIEEDEDMPPKRILSKITSNRKKEEEKEEKKRNPKYSFEKKHLPSLKQVIVLINKSVN